MTDAPIQFLDFQKQNLTLKMFEYFFQVVNMTVAGLKFLKLDSLIVYELYSKCEYLRIVMSFN